MLKKISARMLSILLVVLMLVGMAPASVFAAHGSVTNYADFLANLKQLEVYADAFAAQTSRDAGELVLNFIRTGVERYQDGNWAALAGEEITVFTDYVEEQDAVNGTTVMNLRDIVIEDFTLPNGNPSDFGHMFGTMNISYVATAVQSDDLAGWAGDLNDLLYFSALYGHVPSGTVEEMTAYIRENCFGVSADDAFGWDDFYGDMDAFYLIREYQLGNGSYSDLMENYFTAELNDVDRSVYFLNNRFPGMVTREDVRTAMYNAYRTNVGIQILEADRGISDYDDLRQACCYALADYLFDNAEGNLEAGGGEDAPEDLPDNGIYTVFSTTSSVLAPGITQDINYALTADGKQMVYYVANVDVNRDDVTIMANYKDNDPSKGWGMQRVEDQVAALVKNNQHVENFTPVVATNGDGFNTTTGEPGGLLVMNGTEWHGIDNDGFFGILKDGSAIIGTRADYEAMKDDVVEGLGLFGSGKLLIENGQFASGATAGTRASRTAIGIKADGTVVMMVLDGRQEPFSCGGSLRDIAQIMLEAGCEIAVNLDGGGSTTYMSKPEGSDSIQVVSRPSDGYARSVGGTLVAVSTAKSSKEFDRAIIQSDYDYLTKGTQLQMTAVGVNNIGSSAEIPEGAYWTLSDDSLGSITADGMFTAVACTCEYWGICDVCQNPPAQDSIVEVRLMVGEEIVGAKDLHIVIPETLEFTEKNLTLVYGESMKLPLLAKYNGNPVAMNINDFYCYYNEIELFPDEEWAIFDGDVVTALEEAGARTMTIFGILIENEDAYCEVKASMFHKNEATFDFDNATAGNRTLAWLREVENATTTDNLSYKVTDPDKDVALGYTFALDMNTIEIPAHLADIVFMLPNSDTQGDSAFGYMLALAERVSILTEVRITAQFDKDLDVDVSGLQVFNDFFALQSATVDADNKLTLICNWIDRTEAIDPVTANPMCILTGIKATPKSDAWDSSELIVANSGNVSYDVYLRASSLYSFALRPENQEKYGLIPYVTSETGWEGGTETGAHYVSVYADFEDGFIIDKAVRQGWYKEDDVYKYYIDHKPVTGVQYLPSREDAATELFYEFNDEGVCLGKMSGTVEYKGGIYYAVNGEKTTGWISAYDAEGNEVYYYFNPSTGKAVNGAQTIDGYDYIFTDYILTRGDLVTDANGTRYRWAGQWVHGKWFQVDGNWYTTRKYIYYVSTGLASVPAKDDLTWKWHLFDENGVFQEDYTGIYQHEGEIYYVNKGLRDSTVGLVYEDGYYYYISPSDAKAYRSRTAWINRTNGLMPAGHYTFDEYGRMVNPPVQPDEPDEPIIPDEPDEPIIPDEPEESVKDGVVNEDGVLVYYVNGARKPGAGVVQFTDEQGVTYYIYVRSNAQLAIGDYWITHDNGMLESGKYTFDSNGRYYPPTDEPDEPIIPDEPDEPDEPTVPEVKDGIIEEDGVIRYYINGVRQNGNGIVKLTDENGLTYYIYVRSNAQLATGVYWPTRRNDLLPRGGYDWGADGKYYPPTVDPDEPDEPTDPDEPDEPTDPDEPDEPTDPDEPDEPELKNGIYKEGDYYYYYVDGVRQSGNGVVKLTDEDGREFYIYVRSSNGRLATGKYWPTHRNDLLPRGEYDWGTDGRYYPAD